MCGEVTVEICVKVGSSCAARGGTRISLPVSSMDVRASVIARTCFVDDTRNVTCFKSHILGKVWSQNSQSYIYGEV